MGPAPVVPITPPPAPGIQEAYPGRPDRGGRAVPPEPSARWPAATLMFAGPHGLTRPVVLSDGARPTWQGARTARWVPNESGPSLAPARGKGVVCGGENHSGRGRGARG